jgi:hypothetical protein
LNYNVATRVKFTGSRINYKKEYAFGFSDYLEAYNPTAVTNNVEDARTQPCIILYPSTNINGSWIMLNLETNEYVRQTQWKMVTTDAVISKMTALARHNDIQLTDLAAGSGEDNRVEEPTVEPLRVHMLPVNLTVTSVTADEANIADTEEQAVVGADEEDEHPALVDTHTKIMLAMMKSYFPISMV